MSRTEHFDAGAEEECAECGGAHASVDHDEYDDTHRTDWDVNYRHVGDVHRGIAVQLPPEVHRIVHDETAPIGKRARALIDHFNGDYVGTHWSMTPSQGQHYADVSAYHNTGSYHDRGQQTRVVFHASKPARDEIETDDETLRDQHVIGLDAGHEDAEVPMQHNASMRIKGVSWASPLSEQFTDARLPRAVLRA